MGRILFLFIIVAVGYLLWKRIQREKQNKQLSQKNTEITTKKMVKCHHCGLHVPKAECIEYQQKHYCSLDHAQKHTEKLGKNQ